jgi:hypothetical protein
MKYKPLPSAELLWEIFDYKPLTGELIRKDTGKVAGSIEAKGYRTVRIRGLAAKAHRIVWAWVTGKDPGELQVDHIDQNKDNNRISNLRLVDTSRNKLNNKAKGYSWHKRSKKFQASITVRDRTIYLGYHETEEAAHQAYLNAKHQHLAA